MGYRAIGRFVYDSPTLAAVDSGGYLPFASATATGGLSSDGSAVTVPQCGVFAVSLDATLVAGSTDVLSLRLTRNGVAVPGAHAYATPAAEGDYVPLSFATVVTVPKCGQAVLAVECPTAASVAVANLVVAKLA